MMARTKHTASLPGQGEKRSQHPGVGPPNPTNSTPSKQGEVMVGSGTVLMDGINEGQDVVDWCGRQDPMSQVKNVAWPAPCLLQNALRALPYIGPVSKEHGRIEIPLHAGLPQALPGLVQLDAKIYPNDVPSCLTHEFQQRSSARPEVDHRHTRRQVGNHRLRVWEHELPVVGRRERADP